MCDNPRLVCLCVCAKGGNTSVHEAFCGRDVTLDLWQGGAGSHFWISVGPRQVIFDCVALSVLKTVHKLNS